MIIKKSNLFFTASSLFALVFNAQAIASNPQVDSEDLVLKPKICFIAYTDKDLLTCLKDVNNLLKTDITKAINSLKERDRLHLLNTKGLYSQALLGSCERMPVSQISVQKCKSQVYITYLNYINERYSES